MTGFDRFRCRIDDLVYEAEQEPSETVATRRERVARFRDHADVFARNAAHLRREVIDPRIEYVEALFPHAVRPDGPDHGPHRIRLVFHPTAEFPCSAELTVDVGHAPAPGRCTVTIDPVILPPFLADSPCGGGTRAVVSEDPGHANLVALLDDVFADFVRLYLQTRSEPA